MGLFFYKETHGKDNSPVVAVVDIDDMIINPIVNEVITEAIEAASKMNAQCLIIRMDTPGGLLETTHKIVKEIMTFIMEILLMIMICKNIKINIKQFYIWHQ